MCYYIYYNKGVVYFFVYNAFFLQKISEGDGNMFDSDLTRHLAQLSKITFTDGELQKMTNDMTEIIALMDKVREFNENVDPYTLDAVDYNNLRNDNAENSNNAEEITRNAKNVKNNSFVVPKVV